MSTVFVIGSLVACCVVRVERFPEAGESLCASNFVLEPGGKGFNMLLGLHRLGVEVDGVLPVGDDLFGTLAPCLLHEAGLAEALLWCSPGPSGGGVGFIDATGETSLAVSSGANARLKPEQVQTLRARIAAATWTLAQFETSDDAIAAGFAIARGVGARTLLNPSPYRPVRADILAATTVLVVNEIEAAAMAAGFGLSSLESGATGEGYDRLAQCIHASGPELFITTLGSRGARAWLRDVGSQHQTAFEVETVDALGAGDAFNAGLISALMHDMSETCITPRALSNALRWASACGALATLEPGVFAALPDKLAVQHLLDQARFGSYWCEACDQIQALENSRDE